MPQQSTLNPQNEGNRSDPRLAAELAGMSHLYELNQGLVGIGSLDTALKEILVLAIKFTGTDRGNIQLFREDKNELEIVADGGMGEPFVDHFRNNGCDAVCQAVFRNKVRVIIEDVKADKSLIGTKDLDILVADGIHAFQSTPLITRNGDVIGVLSTHYTRSWRPVADQLALIDLLASIAADFIEHHRTEESLRKSEEKYRNEAARLSATLKSMSDAVYIGDMSGITLANQPALDQLGYSNYEDLNRNIGTLSVEIQTRDAETNEIILPERQAFARALAGEHVTQNVRISQLNGGSERIVRSAASPVEVDGKIVAAVAVNTDITEQWKMAAALKQSEEKLREFNELLELQVKERTAELTGLLLKQKELEERQQQEIFRTILHTQEVERKRIAETLHNSLGQMLYAAKLSLELASKSSAAGSDKEDLKNTDKLLNDAITESRRLSHELMPVILEDFGLKAAVEDICRRLSGKTQFKCRFQGAVKRLDKYMEIAIYRLVQELMMNVVKHAAASSSMVSIEVYHNRVHVLLQDDGKGFAVSKEKGGGIGLKTIRNNVSLLKGRIDIASKPGNGTIITIDIPF